MEPIQNPFIAEPNPLLASAKLKFGRAGIEKQQQYAQEDMQKEMMRQQLAMSQPQQPIGLIPDQGLVQPQIPQGVNFG